MNNSREPVFNVPAIMLALIAVMGFIHAVFFLFLTQEQAIETLLVFSFIPARYDWTVLASEPWTHGWGAAVWSFVTYAFLHGGLSHLFFNMIWLLAFGTPVARRFGPGRFFTFFLVTAAAGAVAHLVTHPGQTVPMIGASAAIAGAMAAALRFVFQRGGPLALLSSSDPDAYRVPAAPLSAMLLTPRALLFVAVWFGLNALFGAAGMTMPGMQGQSIAWQAHVGGFIAGLLLFSWFDPVREQPTPAKADMTNADAGPGSVAPEPSEK